MGKGEIGHLDALSNDFQKALPDIRASLRDKAHSLKQRDMEVKKLGRMVQTEIEEQIALPRIPHKCDYIKRAMKGH